VTTPLPVGVIGCGAIARLAHLPVLASLGDARVVAVADADPGRLAAARAQAPGAQGFASPEELLARSDAAAVVIAVPTSHHAACATAAFASGRHVYLEKPLATSVAEARGVVGAWRQAGTVGAIGFNYRQNPLYAAAAAQVRAGAIGEPIAIRAAFSTTATHADGAWRTQRATGGGVLLDLASHHVDLVRHVTGREVERVSAEVRSHRTEHDTAALLLALTGGLTAQLLVSLASVEEDRFEVYGTAGKLVVDRYRALDVGIEPVSAVRSPADRLQRLARRVRAMPYALTKLRSVGHEPSFRLAMKAFVAAARDGRAMSPDLSDGLASVAVIEAAERSAAEGRPIAVAPATA
jgi:myo-inositol 2-dehydrogenase / D-chiro-inositol 1-dehydrogenase